MQRASIGILAGCGLMFLTACGLTIVRGASRPTVLSEGGRPAAALRVQPERGALKGGKRMLIYIGTYTGGKSKGIYRCTFDANTGALSEPQLAVEAVNPSFLAIHPDGKYLYAVNEVGEFQGKPGGAVSAFAIDARTGNLKLLNQQPTRGGAPCHITLDREARHVLVANYSGGSVIVFPILPDGRLGEATSFVQHEGKSVNPERQEGPHAHSIYTDPSGKYVVSADLGLDQVRVYRYDAQRGQLIPNDPAFARTAPGAGPRHFAFTPDGRYGYVINELGNTVTAYAFDSAKGVLREIQTIATLPSDFHGQNWTADVQVHPSGKFLFGSNRGHDSIVAFAIDTQTGRLTLLGQTPTQGRIPRNFGIDPNGRFLIAANQESDSLVVFRIDNGTGKLTPAGHMVTVGKPVCVQFLMQR